MDLSHMKKVFAGISVAAISLTQMGSVFAAYSDVSAGVWYKEAVDDFTEAGYLDATQTRFRGGDNANRAEFVKLVVELAGGLLSTPPAVPSFSDVSTGAWYYKYFEEAGKEGWVRGDGDCYGDKPCYARPASNINRAEAAALIVRAFELDATGDAEQFADNASGQWYTESIQTAADHCVLQGDDSTGRVRPADNMNRAEMVIMLWRVDQNLTAGVDCMTGGPVAEPMISDVVATSATTVEVEFNSTLDQTTAEDVSNYDITPGITVTDATLSSADTVELKTSNALLSDEEYTVSVDGVMTDDGEEISDSATFAGYSALPKGNGVLELSLAASNPVGDTVPQGAVGVTMESVDFTASCADSVIIENVTVLHEGRGAVGDINGLYAAIDGARVSRKRTIDSEDQTANLRFASPLVLDPCETVTVDIVADFDTSLTAGAEHNLVVELPSDVTSNAKEVRGNFPVRGDMFKIAAVTSGTVSVTYRSISPDEVEVGNKGVVIGKFEVSSNSVEDQTLYSATFEQNGSAGDGDFTNIAVRRSDGTVLTNTVVQTVGGFATLVFDPPFTVTEGDKITLEVIADIAGGAADTIIMHFEETSDLFAVGSLYGKGVNGQLYGSQVVIAASPAADTVTIDAGEFTIGLNGPSTQDYTRDDNDAVLANITMKSGGERLDIKDFFILVLGNTSTGGLLCGGGTSTATVANCATGSDDSIAEIMEDVELRNTTTGRTVDGVRLTTASTHFGHSAVGAGVTVAGTYQVYRFDDFIVTGDETWEFRVDFIDNGSSAHPESGDKFKVYVCGEPLTVSTGTNTATCFGGIFATDPTAFNMDIEGLSTGDSVLDVRPRGTIAGNFHTISNATLTLNVQSQSTTDTIVHNAKDVTFHRFEARAGEAEDILLTKLVLEAQSGSAVSNASNYTLWVDRDGDRTVDAVLQDGVAAQGTSPTISFAEFEGGGYVIPAEETVIFEIHGDVASSPATNDLMLRFATGSSVTYVEAEEVDDGSSLSGIQTNGSSCTSCDIIVTTVNSTLWSLVAQGDLFVNKDSSPLRNRQLLGGALGEAVLRLEFRAENEDIDVTDLRITSSGSNASSVDVLELYKDNATTPFALASRNGCPSAALATNPYASALAARTFCANMETDQLIVPEGTNVDVIVRPRLFTDTQGASSNQTLWFWISAAHNVSDNNTGAILARGNDSSNDLIANDYDTTSDGEVFIGVTTATANNAVITGNNNISVLAKITSIVNANSAANGSAIQTGVMPFGQFAFTAANNSNSANGYNDAVLSGVIFNVNATNVSISNGTFKVYNKDNASSKSTCSAYKTGETIPHATTTDTGSLLVVCNALVTHAINTEIDPGQTITLVLEANVLNSNTSANGNSTLQASLNSFSDMTKTTTGINSGDTLSHIIWQDTDSAVRGTFTWIEYPESTVNSSSYRG